MYCSSTTRFMRSTHFSGERFDTAFTAICGMLPFKSKDVDMVN